MNRLIKLRRRLGRLGQTGVTLIEMLIVMGLLATFLLLLATIFTETLDTETQTRSYSAVVSEGRFIVARLDYDIARASAVTTPAAPGDTSNSLVLTIGGSAYTYGLNDSHLELTDTSGTADLSSSDVQVSNLSFQTVGSAGSGNPTLRYSFTLTGTAQAVSGAESETFTSTAGLQ